MKTDKTWEELCDEVRNAKYGCSRGPGEDLIKQTLEVEEKHLKEDKEGDTFTKAGFLQFLMMEYMVTDVFQVGHVIVKLIGNEHDNHDIKWSKDEDGNSKCTRIMKPGKKGKYYMYRVKTIQPIDAFCFDYGNYCPIDEHRYCSRDEITKIAQKHSDVIEKRSEDVIIHFPTGELCISNYFRENRDQGFDELPKDIKYNSEFSINYAIGREATAQWLADNRNMAYGQLGNTSCSVWKISDDKLVITSNGAYGEDDEGYEVELKAPEGWELVGDICCDVWHIELVDRQGLDNYGFDLEEYKKDHEVKDVKVNAGVWDMKTYYQQRSDEEIMKEFGYPVWAELNRKV